MTGLLKPNATEQAPAAQSTDPMQQGSQEQFDMAAGQLIKWVASDNGYNSIVSAIQASDPQTAMTRLVGRLLTSMNQSAFLAGKKIPPKVLFQAGMEVAKAISMVAQKEGLLDKQSEAQITENAFFDGLALFAQESQEDALTEEDRQHYVQLIDHVQQLASKAQGKPEVQS